MIHKRAKSTGINYVNICPCDDSAKIIFEILQEEIEASQGLQGIFNRPPRFTLYCLCRILNNNITGKVKPKLIGLTTVFDAILTGRQRGLK